MYEVKPEDILLDSEIGNIIGEVKIRPNDMTGDYYGDASNSYPKGTKYYEIKGTPTSTAIAVQEGTQWIKAVYVRNAPFHIMNIFSNIFFKSAVVIIALILIGAIYRTKKFESHV